MSRTLIYIFVILSLATVSESQTTIKVLILDDVFQSIPSKNEKIEHMGRLKGDLLINGTHYPGNIDIWRGRNGLYLINELNLEDYIKSVVSAEVGADWDMEALKAQAVISRTYALKQKSQYNNLYYDITSSVLHQAYKGASENKRVSYAVMTTEGEVLKYNGELIEAFYHSTSGIMTEDAEEVFGKSYPYMKPVAGSCETSPYWIWERRIPAEEIEKALGIKGLKEMKISSFTSTNRVKTIEVSHSKGTIQVKATDMRRLLGWTRLPSTNFTLSHEDNILVFDGKGYGHGVGLCQWSALEMAKAGKTYKEILSYFYPGTQIEAYENR